jgi:hypothetical protein
VNKCDDVSTLVLTHQQVKLVQVGHDDCSMDYDPEPARRYRFDHALAVRAGVTGRS